LLPLIGLLSFLSGWAGRLVDRHGARVPLVAGPLVAALGYALLTLPGTSGSYWTTFFPPITVLGFGMAITVAPLTTTVMTAAGSDRAGVASGINNAVSRAASLLAVAVFGIIVYQRFGNALARRLDALGVSAEVRQVLLDERKKLAAARIPTSLSEHLRQSLSAAVAQAFVDAFRVLSLVAAGLAVAAAVIAFLFIGGRKASASAAHPRRGYPPAEERR
jgi:MFS family permease